MGRPQVLTQNDVLKIDFGVHVSGRIVDSTFTIAFEDKYDPLLSVVRAATNTGVRKAGIDARLGEIDKVIQEVMESHEIELNGKTYPIKCIRNFNGHDIISYKIHDRKVVPIVKADDQTKMEEGVIFAIETFGPTGRGDVLDKGDCSHYSRNPEAGGMAGIKLNSAKHLLHVIDKNFGTLPFRKRYLDNLGHEKNLLALSSFIKSGHVDDHPPLYDIPGPYTCQFEHTFLLRSTCKEVFSRGEYY